MNTRLFARILAATALTGSLFGIAWAQQSKTPGPKEQPPAAGQKENEKEEDEEGSGEQTIKLTDAPKEVQAAINKVTGGKNIKNVIKETDEGVTIYEVEYEADGQPHSADISAGGEVMALEAKVNASALPKAVTDAIAKHHPKGVVKQAETVQEFFYEVVVEVDGKPHAVRINAAGAIEGAASKEADEDDEKGNAPQKEEKEEGDD